MNLQRIDKLINEFTKDRHIVFYWVCIKFMETLDYNTDWSQNLINHFSKDRLMTYYKFILVFVKVKIEFTNQDYLRVFVKVKVKVI